MTLTKTFFCASVFLCNIITLPCWRGIIKLTPKECLEQCLVPSKTLVNSNQVYLHLLQVVPFCTLPMCFVTHFVPFSSFAYHCWEQLNLVWDLTGMTEPTQISCDQTDCQIIRNLTDTSNTLCHILSPQRSQHSLCSPQPVCRCSSP